MQVMMKDNAMKIGDLFKDIFQCEFASRTDIIRLKFIRSQVEVDVRKPIPSGYFHKIDRGTT